MRPESKYDLANQVLRGRLPSELARRRERGDTHDDIMFWLRQKGIRVSRPTVAEWCRQVMASEQNE